MPPGPRIPLPPSLQGIAFITAQGRSMGLGRGDLVYRHWWTIAEYDRVGGRKYRNKYRKSTAQFDHDVQRLEGFADNGWHVVRIVGRSFFADRRGSIARVARVLMNAGWRP